MRTPQLPNETCSTSTTADPRSHPIAHRTLCNQSRDSSPAKAGSLASSYDMHHVGMHQFNHVIHCSVHCVIGLRRNSGTALSDVLCSLHCLRCGCVAPLQRLLGDTQGRVLAPRTITHTLMDHVSWYSVL